MYLTIVNLISIFLKNLYAKGQGVALRFLSLKWLLIFITLHPFVSAALVDSSWLEDIDSSSESVSWIDEASNLEDQLPDKVIEYQKKALRDCGYKGVEGVEVVHLTRKELKEVRDKGGELLGLSLIDPDTIKLNQDFYAGNLWKTMPVSLLDQHKNLTFFHEAVHMQYHRDKLNAAYRRFTIATDDADKKHIKEIFEEKIKLSLSKGHLFFVAFSVFPWFFSYTTIIDSVFCKIVPVVEWPGIFLLKAYNEKRDAKSITKRARDTCKKVLCGANYDLERLKTENKPNNNQVIDYTIGKHIDMLLL